MGDTVIAVVPSAGSGVRFGANKTFARLLDRPVLAWTLQALASAGEVDEVIPVVRESDMARCLEMVEALGIPKVRTVVPGGPGRHDSVMNGLRAIGGGDAVVLVHEGARPLLSHDIISRVVAGLGGFDGCICAAPPKDTIKEISGGGTVARTLNRDALRAVQTPQAFGLSTLLEAYGRAAREGDFSTDDSALVERAGGRVNVVEGSYRNIKITTPEDLEIARILMQGPPEGCDACG